MYYLFQGLNVIYFTMEAIYAFSGSIYVVAAVVFWEGLLGGAAYVNTYFCISKQVSTVDFALLPAPPMTPAHLRVGQPATLLTVAGLPTLGPAGAPPPERVV